MTDRPSSTRFWQSVTLRLLAVGLIGWGAVLWFHGCLAPSIRDEMREEHQKDFSQDVRDSRGAR